jgi:large subunit ribosomal protein L18
MPRLASRFDRREKRKFRIRKRVGGGVAAKPRLSVFRSARHIYVQAVDDLAGRTLATASTGDKEIKPSLKAYPGNRASAAVVGKAIAERLLKLGVSQVVFDRGGYRYHGRVKAVADAAREAGLKF